MQKLRSVIVLVALLVGLCAAALPSVLHVLDRGAETVTVEQLASGHRPQSRNLTVQGVLDAQHIVEKTVKDKDDHVKERRSFLPLVARGWSPAQPVAVIYSTKAWAGFRLEELMARDHHEGVLRDILWEGLDGSVRERLSGMGLHLAERVLLVEEPNPKE